MPVEAHHVFALQYQTLAICTRSRFPSRSICLAYKENSFFNGKLEKFSPPSGLEVEQPNSGLTRAVPVPLIPPGIPVSFLSCPFDLYSARKNPPPLLPRVPPPRRAGQSRSTPKMETSTLAFMTPAPRDPTRARTRQVLSYPHKRHRRRPRLMLMTLLSTRSDASPHTRQVLPYPNKRHRHSPCGVVLMTA